MATWRTATSAIEMLVMSGPERPTDEAARRRRVVRTALLFGAIAFAIYAAFIASGVIGR